MSAALFFYALARTLWLIGHQVLFVDYVPFPWWCDLFFLLQFPCLFLAFLLLPSTPDLSSLSGMARLRLFFDSLLLMGAATLLTWYFLMALIPLQSGLSLPRTIAHLAYPIANLGLLFILTIYVLHLRHPQAERAVLGLLILAIVCLIFGDSWYAILTLSGHYQSGDPPDLFWLLGYLGFPLAALMWFRLTRHKPVTPTERPVTPVSLGLQRQDILEGIRFLLPFGAALLTSMVILVLAPLESRAGRNPLPALGMSLGLLALVLVRQGVVFLEQAQVRYEREAARANELALREGNRQMETFLGIASHELKTPLTAIILRQQMMQRRLQQLMRSLAGTAGEAAPQVAAAQALAETTLQQGGRLNRLVNDLLDTSCIQAGRLELHTKPVDLAAIVRTAVEEQCQAAPERTMLLRVSVEGLALVCADGERIGQVVTNYLTNALRYSQEDRPIEVEVRGESQQVQVRVRDQGPGLPPEEHERIWERFHRTPEVEVQSGSSVGLGIGLYLSKTIIEQHGGQVGVQSTRGQGSTFWFTLPLAAPE